MLHTEVVERTTLELLKRLQQKEPLHTFCLAGGTSLALYLGHRISVDFRPLKAITYFEDIDQNENVVMLKGRFLWKAIEKRLKDMVVHQERIFADMPLR